MNYLRWSALVLLGLALASVGISCGDRDVSELTGAVRTAPEGGVAAIAGCIPGQTFLCMGGCGAPSTGYQVCAADGRSLGPCICPPLRSLEPILWSADREDGGRRIVSRTPPSTALPSAPGAPGAGFGPAPAPSGQVASAVVGASCRSDADCAGGLGCITPGGGQFGGSGPAGGYCTVSCASDASCRALDPGAQCIGFAGQNICARSCASRASPAGVSKCLDRADLLCVSVAARGVEPPGAGPQAGLCLPMCQSDAQCGPGLFCDLGSGLCTTAAPAGDPIGSTCDGADSCASGLCLTLDQRFLGVCSAFCRFGGPGCGFDASSAQPGAGCALAQVPGEGVGDRGLCLELCQTASDCQEPGAVCIPTAAGSTTRACVVPAPAAPPVAPDAGAPNSAPPTGSECAAAADCGSGATCLSPESDPFGLGGGFGGGYCSAVCTNSACPAGSVCVGTAGSAEQYCLRACTPEPLSGGDCGDRGDLVCIAFGADPTSGFCLPDCTLGGDCGDLVCDPELGVCVDAPVAECAQDEDCASTERCESGTCVASSPPVQECAQGEDCSDTPALVVGASCTSDAECPGGLCAPFNAAGDGFCSAFCRLGTSQGCEVYGSDAFCLLDVQNPIGACAELCDTAADCEQSGFECLGLAGLPGGRSGVCQPAAASSAPASD